MEITLDCPDNQTPVYCPGDIVSGTVRYNIYGQRKCLQRLVVGMEVKGYITVDPNTHDGATFDLDQELFSRPISLSEGAIAVQQPLIWPIRFMVPSRYEYNGGKWLLPPSFSQIFPGIHKRAAFCVMVQYTIRATAWEDSSSREVHACKALTVQQAPPQPHTQKEILVPIPMTPSSVRSTRCRQIREKLQVFLDIKSRPHAANFQATAGFPKRLYRGQTAAVHLHVHKGIGGPFLREPSLTLRSLRLRLQGTLQTIAERQITREYGTYASQQAISLSLQDKPNKVVSNLSIDSFAQGTLYLPDFYNPSPFVRHTHFIDIEMEVIEEGTGCAFHLSGRCSVTVLPPVKDGAIRRDCRV